MGAILKVGGDLFSGGAEQAAANAQKKIARANAVTAERNADWTMASGESLVSAQGMKNLQRLGAIRARGAASGVDVNSGSSAKVQQSSQELGQLDAMTIQSNAARAAFGYKEQARNFRNQAAVYKAEANNAMVSAGIQAATDLDESLSKAALAF